MLILKLLTTQHCANKTLKQNLYTAILILLTFFSIRSYGQSTQTAILSPPSFGLISKRQEQLILSLSENPKTIPAWLIAELLPSSQQLYRFLTSDKNYLTSIKLITLNQLLANSSEYRAKLIAIHAIFGTVKHVSDKLILASPDRCWSVIAFDAKYLHPIQCFTAQYPSGFRKGRQIYIIGYYIANRWDCQENNAKILVPVLVGACLPAFSGNYNAKQHKSFKGFLGLIATLILLYLIVRIYIAKTSGKNKSYYNNRYFKKTKR